MIRLFHVFVPTSTIALILSEIIIIFATFLGATILIVADDPEVYLLYEGGLRKIILVVASVILGLYFEDLYSDFRVRSHLALFQQLCLIIGLTFFLQALLTYLNPALMMSRLVMMVACAVLIVVIPLYRIAFSSVIVRAFGGERVLFVGTSEDALRLTRRMQDRGDLGLTVMGFLDNNRERGESLCGASVLGPIASLREVVSTTRPDRIVVALSERRQLLPVYDLLDLRFAGIRIEEAATLYESTFGRVSVNELRPSQLIFTAELGPQPRNMAIQSLYSRTIASLAILPFAPIMLIVAILVKLTSRGPILYRQSRVGLNGVPFTLYKFRSMRTDAEATTGAVWARKDDPRVTPIGKYLRRLRLDELPQLWNVVRGEMSIVGPRPERPEFVRMLSEKIPFYRQRHAVRPGITGWAQINYKYGESLEDAITKLEYDLYYIKNLSPSLDLYIMFHTFKVMLGQVGH